MLLSGNFGEIRTDHFHSGIDIKTRGTIGHHIFSIEEGYVSRIKVQANGYGKSVYIAHPNGYTSVYGHLDRYNEVIAAYVKQVQYERRSHQVDIYLEPGEIEVTRGEFIAYSGNSGSSSGPHLHFEIRTTGNQHPTNVLSYGFDIQDRVAPRFRNLFVYPVNNTGLINGSRDKFRSSLVIDRGIYTIPWGTKLSGRGALGVAVEVFDYLDGASNRCGVYTLEVFVDDKLTYHHVMDEFSFSETRYINAHIEYGERVRQNTKAHRLHRLPNDRLRIYRSLENDGIIAVNESRDYQIRVVARDVAGNESMLEFRLNGNPDMLEADPAVAEESSYMRYNTENSFSKEPVQVYLPENALYEDIHFRYKTESGTSATLSEFHHIHTAEVPVHRAYTLSIDAGNLEVTHPSKLLLVTPGDEGELESAGGQFENGKVVASLRNFGPFAIAIDTVAPTLTALNGPVKGDLSGKKTMRFRVTDDLSGLEKYEGYIDNRWALFEYDPKNDLLTYRFDPERLNRNTEHELELYVSDEKGNTTLFHSTFTW